MCAGVCVCLHLYVFLVIFLRLSFFSVCGFILFCFTCFGFIVARLFSNEREKEKRVYVGGW